AMPAPVKSYFPNAFGLYNMSGNVSEWVRDVYRKLNPVTVNDLSPFRGNVYKDPKTDEYDEPYLDSLGNIAMQLEPDSIASQHWNYMRADLRGYLDGDSASKVTYAYGKTTLINKES